MNKNIDIVHYNAEMIGGSNVVFWYYVAALNGAGVTPDVYMNVGAGKSPAPPDLFYGVSGPRYTLHRTATLPLPKQELFGSYLRALENYLSFKQAGAGGSGALVSTGNVIPFAPCLSYTHNPANISLDPRAKSQLPLAVYLRLASAAGRSRLLANSSAVRERIRRRWRLDSTVIYPPVDDESFSRPFDEKRTRSGIISLGRFCAAKRQSTAQVEIARQMRDTTFSMVGGLENYSRDSRNEFAALKARIEELDLRNVVLYPNLPREKLLSLFAETRFFVHSMKDEDFGIATAEAVIAGLVPVVHDSGGSREIVPDPALRWRTTDEAVRMIRSSGSLDTAPLRAHCVRSFSYRVYQKRMLEETERYAPG